MKRFILISMVLLCMALIFNFSSENASDSMDTTIKVSNIINVDSNYFHALRKSGHFLEFFTLEFLILLLISSFRKVEFKYYIISLLFCLMYAFSDEVHQLFVVGRSASIMDVALDFSGSTLSCIFFYVLEYIYYEGFVK